MICRMRNVMIEADAGKRGNAKERVINYLMEGIFWTVSKDRKEVNRWSRQRIATVESEELCAKARKHQRIGDIYEIAVLKGIRGRGVQQDQAVKGPDICTVFRNWHLRENTITLLVRVKGFPDMANWSDVPGWPLAEHIQGTASKLLWANDVC